MTMQTPSSPQPGAHSHTHSHAHPHARANTVVPVGASLLRMSVAGRLGIAAVGVALIWAGVYVVTG